MADFYAARSRIIPPYRGRVLHRRSHLTTYQAAPPEGDARLTMLGAKSTCKDRWRQVLAEAEKISRKHLLTLEPGISEPQTHQMEASSLQLVVPQPVQGSYTNGPSR